MPNWTKEQLSAITTRGKNIIVSAGAGSGKTEVLSERVIHNLIAGNQKSSPFRAALEWFGFAKKSRTETIDMVKQD